MNGLKIGRKKMLISKCNKLIDADELIKYINKSINNGWNEYTEMAIDCIYNSPAVDAIPIEWIKEHYGWLTMANEIIDDWSKENV